MLRYLVQTDDDSCGVIAAMNFDIWRGKKVSMADFDTYAKLVHYDPEWGTADFYIEDWLGLRYIQITLDKLTEHLELGGAAILYSTNHFYFVDKIQDNKIRTINFQGKLITWIPCEDIELKTGWLCDRI